GRAAEGRGGGAGGGGGRGGGGGGGGGGGPRRRRPRRPAARRAVGPRRPPTRRPDAPPPGRGDARPRAPAPPGPAGRCDRGGAAATVLRRKSAAQRFGGSIGVERRQQDAAAVRPDVRLIDSGVRHHIAEPMLGDQQAFALAHHAARFRQDELDESRILGGLRC